MVWRYFLLKRLSDAIADGDNILAVIKGSAMNNDGSVKIGYAAPSITAQAEVIAMAQAAAGIDPGEHFLHRSPWHRNSLGDPIEVAALTQAFRDKAQKTMDIVPSGPAKHTSVIWMWRRVQPA